MPTTPAEPIAILGGGGHAKVVISTFRAMGITNLRIYDGDTSKVGSSVLGVTIEGDFSSIPKNSKAIIAIGNNKVRKQLVEKLPELEWVSAVHPSAIIDSSVSIGPGTVVFPLVVINPSSQIGSHVILNSTSVIEHDCVIASFAHIAPGAKLCGGVKIGEGALVGVGSSVIPCRSIGNWTVIGAGAAVVKDIPDHVTAVGVPASPR